MAACRDVLVAFIHSLTGPASTNPVPGNAATGKDIFWGAKAGCANCHAIGGQGALVGPQPVVHAARESLLAALRTCS